MSKLPLVLRKNIRDTDGKLKENIAKIEKALGVSGVQVDFDYGFVNENLGSSYKNRAGWVLNDAVMGGVASVCVSKWSKDEAFAKPFAEAWTSKLITYRIVPDVSNYTELRLDNGVLVIACKKFDQMVTNVHQIGQNIMKTVELRGEGNVNTRLASNMAKEKSKHQAITERLQKAVGLSVPVTFDGDYGRMNAELSKSYVDRLGEVLTWVLDGLASNVERQCKDDMVKEALQEEWCGRIRFSYVDSLPSGIYHDVNFADKVMEITSMGSKMASNVGDTGKNLEDKL
eukprot:TRINITY_DN2726_c0_g1_i1.p1 TRINITY_DN2726_c0_g1~~TRINITY_DN2726_c0_g1_i1.p1  ORF type:complete len:297 (-),score=87.12 TRINITY_DN2726_c0_g1_i1:48-905(-)